MEREKDVDRGCDFRPEVLLPPPPTTKGEWRLSGSPHERDGSNLWTLSLFRFEGLDSHSVDTPPINEYGDY